MSSRGNVEREPANQGEFSTCSAYAMWRIITEILILKYDVVISFEKNINSICHICNAYKGSNAVSNAKAITEGKEQFQNVSHKKRYKIAVTVSEEQRDFDTLYTAVKRAHGTPLVYVAVSTGKRGHGRHAIAGLRIHPSPARKEILCINSWGDAKARYPCTKDNLTRFYVVDVKITKTWNKKGEISNPPCREGVQELIDGLLLTPEQMYFKGSDYYYGRNGVAKDFKQAVFWYRKSADQGNASAQNSLGYCYYKGHGVAKDFKQAVFWYRKSADQGNALGQSNLGYCYKNGEGVAKDFKQAVFWYRKSADQGDKDAKEKLSESWAEPYI